MFIFQKKSDNIGEIHVIVTEQDRASLIVDGTKWIDLNYTLNDFNSDPNITDCKLTASYAGDLDDDIIANYINEHYKPAVTEKTDEKKTSSSNTNNNDKSQSKKNTKELERVDSNSRIIKCDENGEEWESDETLQEYLQNEDLTCPECGEIGKALVNKQGEILPCKGCIEIDAYLKGKEKGYESGYQKGFENAYSKMIEIIKNITDKKTGTKKLTHKDIENVIKKIKGGTNNEH